MIFKIIIAGAFYNKIFIPEYQNFIKIKDKVLNVGNNQKSKYEFEFKTNTNKMTSVKMILNEIIRPNKILDCTEKYFGEIYSVSCNNDMEIKKILSIISKIHKYHGLYLSNGNFFIKINETPNYDYSLIYKIENTEEIVNQDMDSINYVQIITNYKELKNLKLLTNEFNINYDNDLHFYNIKAKYSSVISDNFDIYIKLIFYPNYIMNISTNEFGIKTYDGIFYNNKIDIKNNNDLKFMKLEYIIKNFHLLIINKIRLLLNENIEFEFLSKDKADYKNLFNIYKFNVEKLFFYVNELINEITIIKKIPKSKYKDLSLYIKNIFYKNENFKNDICYKNENYLNNINFNFIGYMNEIKFLKSKDNYFLKLILPKIIDNESFLDNKIFQSRILMHNYEISNLYNNFLKILKYIEDIIKFDKGIILCQYCNWEICQFDSQDFIVNNSLIGEYKIIKFFENNSFYEEYNYKNKEILNIINIL